MMLRIYVRLKIKKLSFLINYLINFVGSKINRNFALELTKKIKYGISKKDFRPYAPGTARCFRRRFDRGA